MIKILLADDQYLMLESIKAIFKHEPEIEVVGTAQDGQSAIAQVEKLQPDVVLIYIEMPKLNGIVATKYICKHMPDIRVIVLTSHKNQAYIIQALQAGASNYVLKDSLIEELKQAIYSLDKGYFYSEARLSTEAVSKLQTTNVIKYQEKITYLKKYRKSIYTPPLIKKSRLLSGIFNRQSACVGINKASLKPIFEPRTPSKIPMSNQRTLGSQNRYIHSSPKSNRQKYLGRIIWLLLAIASLIFSLIIF